MKQYYIANANSAQGIEEISYTEWLFLIGESPNREYASKVYYKEIPIYEVPEKYQSDVELIVANRIDKWGEYNNQEISGEEFQSMIEEVL